MEATAAVVQAAGPGALESYRSAQGLSYAALGREIGISRGYAKNICAGRRAPGREIANRIFEVAGIPQTVWDDAAPAPVEAGRG